MLVDAREKLHIPWGDQANQQHGDSLMAFDTRSTKMASGQLEASVFLPYLPAIKALWADVGIQNAYDRRREFQLVGGRWRRRSTQTQHRTSKPCADFRVRGIFAFSIVSRTESETELLSSFLSPYISLSVSAEWPVI